MDFVSVYHNQAHINEQSHGHELQLVAFGFSSFFELGTLFCAIESISRDHEQASNIKPWHHALSILCRPLPCVSWY
jgi:hypothetical protein